MTFLSSPKLSSPTFKATVSIIALSVLSMSALLTSSSALAGSCSKSDIDYYLQRGFTNDQVVKLCASPTTAQGQTYQAPQPTQAQSQQNNQLREDKSYLKAAIDGQDINMTAQDLTFVTRECINHGPANNIDLEETICVTSKLSVNFTGMKVGKSSKGFFLVKDPTVNIKGNIKRDLIGINELRRQDREAILQNLSTNPGELNLNIRRGIDPFTVASLLSKYAK